MQHYVGLDVSVKETSVCIVDKAGKVIREVKVATKPAEILAVLTEEALAIERIGLEAGPLSQWLYSALAEAGLPVICVETRHMKAALSAQINKSDRNDARGIAQMMRLVRLLNDHSLAVHEDLRGCALARDQLRGWGGTIRTCAT